MIFQYCSFSHLFCWAFPLLPTLQRLGCICLFDYVFFRVIDLNFWNCTYFNIFEFVIRVMNFLEKYYYLAFSKFLCFWVVICVSVVLDISSVFFLGVLLYSLFWRISHQYRSVRGERKFTIYSSNNITLYKRQKHT